MKRLLYFIIVITLVIFAYFESNTSTAQLFQKSPPALKLGDAMPANLFVELAKAINPSVVNISTSVIPQGRAFRDPMQEMLEQFYGIPRRRSPQPGKPQRMGLGTGFIIREDGLIVTNNHVIDGADIIEVQLTEDSNKQYKAEVIGRDARTDIALIKIKADVKLTAAALGSSTDTQVGEWVAAFGNPYGHGHTMTKGIISSKGREIEEINRLPLLQTDASINPGNSGGPLVNSKGFVIGVNSAIDARAQGIGFAIPIDEVKKIIPQLEQRGSIRKGFLGIGLGDIDTSSAQAMGYEDLAGAVVLKVDDGPGKKAGLKQYDIITDFNGKKIKNSRDLTDAVSDAEPGQQVKMKVLRGEKSIDLTITPTERPSEKTLAKTFGQQNDSQDDKNINKKSNTPHNLGAQVSDLTNELRSEFNLNSEVRYPIITAVDRGSIASQIGLRVGDLILSVNKIEPKNAQEAIKAFKKGQNTLRLARGRGLSVLTFDLN
ncbi:MAG: trypsin-like peptidase domain-containing protein [Pseudobdellovibrio sp.]